MSRGYTILSHQIRTHIHGLLTALILGIFCSTAVSAQTVHKIYGTGFSPTSLKEGQRLPRGTSLVEADEETILILKREWKIESGKCVEMVVIGNNYYYLDQDQRARSDSDCRAVGDATAVMRAMDGDSVKETIRMPFYDERKTPSHASGGKKGPLNDPSRSDDPGYDASSMLKQLNNDIDKLNRRKAIEVKERRVEAAAQQQKAREAAQRRREETASQLQREEAAAKRQREESAAKGQREESVAKGQREESTGKGQREEKQSRKGPRPTCTLSGRVLHIDTGEPLAGVRMDLMRKVPNKRLQNLSKNVATTGRRGEFTIDCTSISGSYFPLKFGLHRNDWKATYIVGPEVERPGIQDGLILRIKKD